MFYGNKSRAKNGTETTQIELAEKILDRDGLSFLDEILRRLVNRRMASQSGSGTHCLMKCAIWQLGSLTRKSMNTMARTSKNGESGTNSLCLERLQSCLVSSRASRVMQSRPDINVSVGRGCSQFPQLCSLSTFQGQA